MDTPKHEPTLSDVIEANVLMVTGHMHTAFPATIESYDPSTAKASVLPTIARKFDDDSILNFPVISDVPVVWMRTSVGSITFPLNKGDGVLIICAERSLDEWLTKGSVTAPEDKRRFALSDAIAIPGLFAFNTATGVSGNEDFQIAFKDQLIKIKGSGDITLGSGTVQTLLTLAYKTALETFLSSVVTALSGLGVVIPPFVPPVNGVTSKVKAE